MHGVQGAGGGGVGLVVQKGGPGGRSISIQLNLKLFTRLSPWRGLGLGSARQLSSVFINRKFYYLSFVVYSINGSVGAALPTDARRDSNATERDASAKPPRAAQVAVQRYDDTVLP